MLQALRKFSKSPFALLVLFIPIMISFAIWGINDVFRGTVSTTALGVGDNVLDVTVFQREYQNYVRNQGRMMGIEFTPEQAARAGIPKLVQEMTLDRLATDNLSNRIGLTASEKEVVDAIRAQPNFNGPAGVFDHNVFLAVISQAQLSEAEALAIFRTNLIRNQLEFAVGGGFLPPPRLLAAWYAFDQQTRAAEYIVLPASAAGAIANPSDAQLSDYVRKNAQAFSTAQYREISYATLSPADLAAKIPVSDAEVKQEFEARKANYVTPEKRDLEQIVFPNEADAKAGRAKIDGGTSFADLAKQRGLKASDLPIGTFAKSELDAVRGDVAFALAENGVSQPVKGPFGWVLLHVTRIAAGSNKTFEDVKEDIRKGLQTQGAVNQLIDTVNKFVDERAGGATVEQAARSAGMQYNRVAAVDAKGLTPSGEKAALPADPEFLTQAFSVEAGEDLEPVQAQSGNYFVLRVEGITPPKVKPLSEIREAATKAWIAEQQMARLKGKAEALAAQATRQQSLVEAARGIGGTVQKTASLSRNMPSDVMSAATLESLFLAKPGAAVAGPAAQGGGYVVARVTGISYPKLPKDSAEVSQAVQQITGRILQDLRNGMSKAVQAKEGVTVNKTLVAQATGEGS